MSGHTANREKQAVAMHLFVASSRYLALSVGIALGTKIGHAVKMKNPWRTLAIILAAALVALAIFTALLIPGIMDFGLTLL